MINLIRWRKSQLRLSDGDYCHPLTCVTYYLPTYLPTFPTNRSRYTPTFNIVPSTCHLPTYLPTDLSHHLLTCKWAIYLSTHLPTYLCTQLLTTHLLILQLPVQELTYNPTSYLPTLPYLPTHPPTHQQHTFLSAYLLTTYTCLLTLLLPIFPPTLCLISTFVSCLLHQFTHTHT